MNKTGLKELRQVFRSWWQQRLNSESVLRHADRSSFEVRLWLPKRDDTLLTRHIIVAKVQHMKMNAVNGDQSLLCPSKVLQTLGHTANLQVVLQGEIRNSATIQR